MHVPVADINENLVRHSTPSEESRNTSDPVLRTSSGEDVCSSKQQKATNKRVCFSMSPNRKERSASSPSKNAVCGTKRKQQRVSPKRPKPLHSPVKSKEQRTGNQRDGIVSYNFK